MKSNFQMLTELLNDFHPSPMFLTASESAAVTSTLCLKDMDLLSLQNLRDFTVLYLSQPEAYLPEAHRASRLSSLTAVTSVIDHWIIQKGGTV